ncbi:MAG: MgtC/SapB family protein, partial [Flavonifractor sp.]|nr:MgtC/SapB family protein [Flavonifractor sp.]
MDALLDATQLEHLLRIVLAALCGGAVGFERERRFKSAGIRTHLIVALSAALMTVLSKHGFTDVVGSGVTVDASRIAAG